MLKSVNLLVSDRALTNSTLSELCFFFPYVTFHFPPAERSDASACSRTLPSAPPLGPAHSTHSCRPWTVQHGSDTGYLDTGLKSGRTAKAGKIHLWFHLNGISPPSFHHGEQALLHRALVADSGVELGHSRHWGSRESHRRPAGCAGARLCARRRQPGHGLPEHVQSVREVHQRSSEAEPRKHSEEF